MHLTRGELRTYIDNMVSEAEQGRIRLHLSSCAQCRHELETLTGRADVVSERLTSLTPDPVAQVPRVGAALSRFEERRNEKENNNMLNRLFKRKYRPAWAVLGVVVILVVALTFQPVRAIANSFLGLFRVQQIEVVQVNPGNLPDQLGSSAEFEALLSQDLQVEELGEVQPAANAGEASQLAGIPVRLPALLQGEPQLDVQPAARMTFNVDLEQIQTILREVGYGSIQLPPGLDGAAVTVDIPNAVTATYGSCQEAMQAAREGGYDPDDPMLPQIVNCTTLVQMPSPSISAPPGLDVAKIGQAYLQVLGMTPEEAASFAENVDWTTTFVIPIPRYGVSYQDVYVDGVDGTLLQQDQFERHPEQYLLMWVKDGIIYALTGQGDMQAALEVAGSLK